MRGEVSARSHREKGESPVCQLSSRHVQSSSQTSQARGMAIVIPLRVYTVAFCSNVYSIHVHLLAFIVLCYPHAFATDPMFVDIIILFLLFFFLLFPKVLLYLC